MIRRRSMNAFFLILLSWAHTPLRAADDVVVDTRIDVHPAVTYSKHQPIAVKVAVDRRLSADPRFLGVGPEAFYDVFSDRPPAEYLRDALNATLRALGLSVVGDETATRLVTVELWRARTWLTRNTDVRIRVRAEVGLRFRFESSTGQPLGTIFALGNAEAKRPATPKNWEPVFQAALRDALEKFAGSRTLRQVLDPDVAASRGPATGDASAALPHIDRSQAYGPTSRLKDFPAIDLGAVHELQIADLTVDIPKFKGDEAAAARAVPDALANRLLGMYPGLFSTMTRLPVATPGASTLVVSGEVVRIDPGRAQKRVWIGFGAGKVALHVRLHLALGGAPSPAAVIDLSSETKGLLGLQLDDMLDQVATDLASYIVAQRTPRYTPDEEQLLF